MKNTLKQGAKEMKIVFDLQSSEKIMLRGDSFNFELCRIVKSTNEETGNITESFVAFKWFQSLPQALSKILELKVRASEATSLKELASDLEIARGELMAVWSTQIKGVK